MTTYWFPWKHAMAKLRGWNFVETPPKMGSSTRPYGPRLLVPNLGSALLALPFERRKCPSPSFSMSASSLGRAALNSDHAKCLSVVCKYVFVFFGNAMKNCHGILLFTRTIIAVCSYLIRRFHFTWRSTACFSFLFFRLWSSLLVGIVGEGLLPGLCLRPSSLWIGCFEQRLKIPSMLECCVVRLSRAEPWRRWASDDDRRTLSASSVCTWQTCCISLQQRWSYAAHGRDRLNCRFWLENPNAEA